MSPWVQARMLVFSFLALVGYASAEIGGSALINKLVKIKPVGKHLARSFIPLTEIPTPHGPTNPTTTPSLSGRRHLDTDPDCTKRPGGENVYEGSKVHIFGDYYDDMVAKTVATVLFPDHIDHRHFEVTTQVPYLTVGVIEAIGYNPSTPRNIYPPECEKIYQDHLAELYSDDDTDYSDESLEVARMPLFPEPNKDSRERYAKIYSDLD